MRTFVSIVLTLLLLPLSTAGQHFGFEFPRGKKKVKIPFEVRNNFIILSGRINELVEVKFILDTGSRHIIITRREYGAFMNIIPGRVFTIMGADRKTELSALLATSVKLDFSNIESGKNSVLILEEDLLQLDQVVGSEVHGILGSDFFRQFVMKIDYKNQQIVLYERKSFTAPEKFKEFPLIIERDKPFLECRIELQGQEAFQSLLLLDTGADFPILLYTDAISDFDIPENAIKSNIGRGLGGYLEGYIGRIKSIKLGDYQFDELITNFQDFESLSDSLQYDERQGIIGGGLLSRFEVIIDYQGAKLYLKARKQYNKRFRTDMSGLMILATGEDLHTFLVYDVVKNSAADLAGIKKGDYIRKINFKRDTNVTLSNINKILRSRNNRKIKMLVDSENALQKVQFRLKEIL